VPKCTSDDSNDRTYSSTECTPLSVEQYTNDVFGSMPYAVANVYQDEECHFHHLSVAGKLDGTCITVNFYKGFIETITLTLTEEKKVSYKGFSNQNCVGTPSYEKTYGAEESGKCSGSLSVAAYNV
jgi:hypothetical protein